MRLIKMLEKHKYLSIPFSMKTFHPRSFMSFPNFSKFPKYMQFNTFCNASPSQTPYNTPIL